MNRRAHRLLQLPGPGRHGNAAGRGTDRCQHHQRRVAATCLDRRDERLHESRYCVITTGHRHRHEQRAGQLRLQRILATGQGGGTGHQLGRATPVPSRVSPTDRIHAEIDAIFGSGRDLSEITEDVARLGARLLIQTATRP